MDDLTIVFGRLLFALVAGGVIGLERAFRSRPAGLRTHSLVCTSSSMLMLFTVFQWNLLPNAPFETIRVDPTRMAQGIMTGIGFLGAGVIMKERFTIRGLTTSASIWMTATIGILAGVGFYVAAAAGTVLTLIILAVYGWFEPRMPTLRFARLQVRFKTEDRLSKTELYRIIREHRIAATSPSYSLKEGGRYYQYEATVRSKSPDRFEELAQALSELAPVEEFSLIPTGE